MIRWLLVLLAHCGGPTLVLGAETQADPGAEGAPVAEAPTAEEDEAVDPVTAAAVTAAAVRAAETAAIAEARQAAAEFSLRMPREGVWGTLYNIPVMHYRAPLFDAPPEYRAERFDEHLNQVLTTTDGTDIAYHEHETGTVLLLNGVPLLIVLEGDADPGKTTRSTAEITGERLKLAIQAWRDQRDPVKVGQSVLATLGWTLLLVVLVMGLLRLRRRFANALKAKLGRRLSKVKARQVGRAGFAAVQVLVARIIDLGVLVAVIALLVAWLERCLAAFPVTRVYSDQITDELRAAAVQVGAGFVEAVPGLVVAIMILVATGIIIRAGASAIEQLARFEVGWLDQDTVVPTRRLFSIGCWVLAIVMVYPYLPGSGTDAFKGISVLLGLMVSLGASSLVGQAASGLIVLYTRVLRPGEWVTIGDTEGRVVRIGIFATTLRLRSFEEVAVPNVQILSGKITNHSRSEGGQGVKVAVTIGYDTPWRQVHALLLEAAGTVAGLRKQPEPFVLQSALDDFYVRYELIAVIDDPEQAPSFRHQLHAAIQDAFNRHGVQIMSPHFRGQQGEEPVTTPQDRWYEPPAVPPAAAEPA